MKIDLISIINNEGSELNFSGEVKTAENGMSAISKVIGSVANLSGRLEVNGTVTADVETICARCVAPVKAELVFEISEIVGEDGVALSGTVLDVGEIVAKTLFMNLPMKFLCREDCKGICSKCGVDLNNAECECDGEEIDERLSALKKLLDR